MNTFSSPDMLHAYLSSVAASVAPRRRRHGYGLTLALVLCAVAVAVFAARMA